ncbi:MAG: hypothetical protein IJ459_01880 [Clostridia bacterium]|nr:hypothetical protein [Clostridia bacterium]
MEILKKRLIRLPLQFFAEGAEGGADGEGAESGTENSDDMDMFMARMEQKYGITDGVASAQAAEAVRAEGSVAHSEEAGNAEADDEGAAAAEPTEPTADTRTPEEEFDELIRSDKYKGIYGKKISAAIADRFKAQRDAKSEADKHKADADRYRAALGAFASKYGKSADDTEGILAAIAADDSLLEAEAYKKGTSVESLRESMKQADELTRTKGELEDLRAKLDAEEKDKELRADAARWAAEAKETVKLYPDFDIKTELRNPEFMKYLQRDKMSVTQAYRHAHLDEIMAKETAAIERQAEQNAAKAVQKNQARIREGASAARKGQSTPKIDVRNMTDADYARIEDMLERGEPVTLGTFR